MNGILTLYICFVSFNIENVFDRASYPVQKRLYTSMQILLWFNIISYTLFYGGNTKIYFRIHLVKHSVTNLSHPRPFEGFAIGLMVDMASKKLFQAVLCPTQLFHWKLICTFNQHCLSYKISNRLQFNSSLFSPQIVQNVVTLTHFFSTCVTRWKHI